MPGKGRSNKDKTPVVGVVERNGKIIAQKAKGKTLKAFIKENVEKGSTAMTDEWASYNAINKDFVHKLVNHKNGEYVNRDIYTNTIEGFWTLFKRGVIGQYHQLKARYLDKYFGRILLPVQ